MGFLKAIKFSIYNPAFYAKIKSQSLASSLKYFFLLILVLCLINILFLFSELVIKIPLEIRDFSFRIVDSYPKDLEVTVDNGQVITNTQEPFFVPFPKSGQEIEASSLNNLLVIDTKTPFSSTQFNQYKTLMWLTRDSLFYQNREFDQRSLDLTKFQNIKINRDFIQNIVDKINPWLKFFGPILLLVVFIGLYLGFTFQLIYFLFLGILIFFLSSIFKWGLNYSASYKTAIYASTLGFLVDLILLHTGIYTHFYGFAFMFTLISLCVATINLQNHEKKD